MLAPWELKLTDFKDPYSSMTTVDGEITYRTWCAREQQRMNREMTAFVHHIDEDRYGNICLTRRVRRYT